MRTFLPFLFGLLTMAAVVALGIVVNQNGQSAQVAFLGESLQVAQGWSIAGAAALGFILAFLLLIPGRLASAMRTGNLSRQGRSLEERLQTLREEYAQLQGSYQRLLAEHQTILSQVLSPVAGARQPAAGARQPITPSAAASFMTEHATERPLRPTGPIVPPHSATRLAHQPAPADPAATPAHPHTSFIDRIRARLESWKAHVQAWFQRQRSHGDDGSSSSNGRTPATT